MLKGLTRALLMVCGTLCVALGVLGMFVPVLPTTPFLLLATACFARSSERFYRWLTTNRLCGEFIRNYREGRGVPLKQKLLSILLLWLMIGYTTWFVVSDWWIRLVMLGIAVGVTLHLSRMKTFKPDAQSPQRPGEYTCPEEPA